MRKLFLLAFAVAGCHAPPTSPSGGQVALVLNVDRRLFAADAALDVELWNAAALSALDANARCASVRDAATGQTTVQCPPGVVFKEVVPEKFTIPLSTAVDSVELTPRSITAGERFRIHASALSADRCNRTAADAVRSAAPRTVLELAWQTTARSCIAP